MSARVIPLGCVTRLDLPVDRVLEEAKTQMRDVVLMGWNNDGELYFASTFSDGGEVMWLLELCKKRLLDYSGKV